MTTTDLIIYALAAIALMGSVAILSGAALKGWSGWLALKRAELDHAATHGWRDDAAPCPPSTATRIDIADLKERIRKLEAIAAGVDL